MRRHKRKSHEEVQLNMAAMLDMAFQLLTFFILTFRPPPAEGQISLRLPPPQAMIGGKAPVGQNVTGEMPKGVDTLVISVFSNDRGDIELYGVGTENINGKPALEKKLKEVFSDELNVFEQVILQVDPRLRYDKLMESIEVCTKQKLPDGSTLKKLSFVPAVINK